MTLIAVINCGSSSIKYRALDLTKRETVADALIEGIGEPSGKMKIDYPLLDGGTKTQIEAPIADHRTGLAMLIEDLNKTRALSGRGGLFCVGHRVVHGGEAFSAPALITDEVIEGIRKHIPLAPLHNPANLVGIQAAMTAAPDVPHVAVFDTAFHQTIPDYAYHYALPQRLYEEYGVRRYGFHGTSHGYVSRTAAEYLSIPLEDFNAVVLHLGNGASATAIRGGKSVDTSMGLTPLEGLVMGTRSGDIDPALPRFLAENAGMSIGDVDGLLNRESGLKGISGDNDMRSIVARMEEGDESARLAFDMFCYRARKYLGAYVAALGRIDAVIFTAGIGENSSPVREGICAGLAPLGIEIDTERNTGRGGSKEIQSENSRTRLLVIPTEEELEIAIQAHHCIETVSTGHA